MGIPEKTEGADIHNGVSIDQVAAKALGQATRFPSLEMGLEGGGLVGNCDSGYSCAYSNAIAWRTPQTPLPPELNPRGLFERLFGDGELHDRPTRLKMAKQDRSLLDSVMQDANQLRRELGATDQSKLDEYLSSVREIERRVQTAEKQDLENKSDARLDPALPKPAGVPTTYEEYARLMFDLHGRRVPDRLDAHRDVHDGPRRKQPHVPVASACRRRITASRTTWARTEKIDKLAKINRLHVELFGSFLAKLKSIPDGDGTLLDHSMIVYGSGLSDGNAHSHHDLPVAAGWRSKRSLPHGTSRALHVGNAAEQSVRGDARHHRRARRNTRAIAAANCRA